MTKPDFWAQIAEPMTDDERKNWIRHASMESHSQGAPYVRVAVDDGDNPKILLVEGWKVYPDPWPQPKFHVTTDP